MMIWFNWQTREISQVAGVTLAPTSWQDVPTGERIHLYPRLQGTTANKGLDEPDFMLVNGKDADKVCGDKGEMVDAFSVGLIRKLRMNVA